MKRRGLIRTTCLAIVVLPLSSCRSGKGESDPLPPPDARRPVLKSEAELAATRTEQVRTGEVVPTETPVVEAEKRPPPPPPRPPRIVPSKNSIRSDILIVNESVLSVADVLYPLREWIEQTRSAQTARGFVEQLTQRLRDDVRNEIGRLLVYEEALAEVPENAREQLDAAVAREVDARVSREFGGSTARFENHLERHGLTMEQYRESFKRRMLVSSYTREMLTPQIVIRRDELLAHYRANINSYSTAETRELLLIALPFERFLPAGATWETASQSARDQAKLQALRQARAAHAALEQREFADVAREYSRGIRAADGGYWGPIGEPLRAPYDELSGMIFRFSEGQTSEPIETETGWYIVRCGAIRHATQSSFLDVQDQIRTELENERFATLAGDYIVRLAERAAISDLSAFINAAVERAIIGWGQARAE